MNYPRNKFSVVYSLHSTHQLSLHQSPFVKRSATPRMSSLPQLWLYISLWLYKGRLSLESGVT